MRRIGSPGTQQVIPGCNTTPACGQHETLKAEHERLLISGCLTLRRLTRTRLRQAL